MQQRHLSFSFNDLNHVHLAACCALSPIGTFRPAHSEFPLFTVFFGFSVTINLHVCCWMLQSPNENNNSCAHPIHQFFKAWSRQAFLIGPFAHKHHIWKLPNTVHANANWKLHLGSPAVRWENEVAWTISRADLPSAQNCGQGCPIHRRVNFILTSLSFPQSPLTPLLIYVSFYCLS